MKTKQEWFRESIKREEAFVAALVAKFGQSGRSVQRYKPETWTPEIRAAWDSVQEALDAWRGQSQLALR
jgi:hypothetical protein